MKLSPKHQSAMVLILTDWLREYGEELAVNLNDGQVIILADILIEYYITNPHSTREVVKQLENIGFGLAGHWEETYNNRESELIAMVDNGKITQVRATGELNRLYKKLIRERCRLIADTGSSIVYNNSSLMVNMELQSDGFFNGLTVDKQWVAPEDELVCPQCSALNNQHVLTNETFDGGFNCPPAHPACRCSIVFFSELHYRNKI